MTAQVYKVAFDGHSLANECEKGVVNTHRIWWVQAETVIGFLNGYRRDPEKTEYLEAAKSEWQFIKDYVIDKREGSEWFWEVDENGKPVSGQTDRRTVEVPVPQRKNVHRSDKEGYRCCIRNMKKN